jgi:hypothetical protein
MSAAGPRGGGRWRLTTADQLLCHAIGDYVLQSHWMATGKTTSTVPALAHALVYAIPFLVVTHSPGSLLAISATHFVIDRWRLARHVCWLKNWLAPVHNRPWSECRATGYPPETPPWLAVWLMIAADNTLHVLLNGWAIRRFGP